MVSNPPKIQLTESSLSPPIKLSSCKENCASYLGVRTIYTRSLHMMSLIMSTKSTIVFNKNVSTLSAKEKDASSISAYLAINFVLFTFTDSAGDLEKN